MKFTKGQAIKMPPFQLLAIYTLLNHFRNEVICRQLGVEYTIDKIIISYRLNWLQHVERTDAERINVKICGQIDQQDDVHLEYQGRDYKGDYSCPEVGRGQ